MNPRPLNSVQTLQPNEPSGHEFNLHSEPTLYSHSIFISLFSVHISFRQLPSSVARFAYMCIEVVARRCSVNKGVLKNFVKFTEKHLCQSLFF